jgi:chemosensory pili system protein ChpA (sensor histidine kinase/response regulator)
MPGAPAVQQVDEEMFSLFTAELAAIQDTFDAAVAALASPDESDDARRDALDNYAEQLERVAAAAGAIGLAALARVLATLRSQLLAAREPGLSGAQAALLAGLAERLHGYFASPTDPSAANALLDLLADAAWPQPLDPAQAQRLAAALTAVELRSAETQARPTRALAEDVSLALPDDLNPELLDGLLLELPVQTSAFTEAVKRIIEGEGALNDIEIAKRAAHTLKGAANTVGVRGIANLTHHLEDILIALGEHGALPNLGLAQTLGYAADCLEAMSEALTGSGEPPADAMSVLQDVLNWANRVDRDGAECAAATASAGGGGEARRDAAAEDGKGAGATAGPMLRVPARIVDELLRLVGETITSTAQIQNRLKNTVGQARAIAGQHALFQSLVGELERLVDLRGIAAPLAHPGRPGEFDALEFEQFSELHTVARRLTEVATDSRELGAAAEDELTQLGELLEDHSRLHLQSQAAVLRTRMVPVASVVSRFHRAVRQAGRILDKQVELKVRGADTLVDSNLLNDLIDPLMHVLRNAVDHGIEPPGRRTAFGKDPVGHIELAFQREGDYIVVRCRDDGAGLDLAAIRRAAVRRGLIDEGAHLADDELGRLVLAPGFSTREEATQVSGRGIGLDVVHSRVLDLKGALHLRTDRGRGLTVEVRVPATLLSAHALLVRVRNAIVAVSTRGLEDIHYVETGELRTLGTELTYKIGNAVHDVVKLDELLNLPGDRRAAERSGFPLLVVRLDSGAARAVIAQEVLETRNLVVKNLGRYVPKIRGVVGAAILGDGSVASVVDLPELLRTGARAEHDASHASTTGLNPAWGGERQPAAARAIVVDDSISARRALAKVVRDAGFEVRAAIDGLEAIALLERMTPDIILTDMEMPRMNGLELTGHVRARTETRDIPVIMVTSRSTEKHRKQAEAAGVDVYLTKPFGEETLLKHIGLLAKRRRAA